MIIETDKSVGYHPGQLVRFFNPWNGDRSEQIAEGKVIEVCLLYTSPSPRD